MVTARSLFPDSAIDRAAQIDMVLVAMPNPATWHKAPDGGRGPLKSTPSTVANLVTIFEADPTFAGRFRLNRLAERILVDGEHVLTDAMEGRLCVRLGSEYKMNVKPANVHEALVTVASEWGYHPVRDYLEALEWDGVPRLDGWLSTYAGAEDTPLHRLYARRWAVSCVARMFAPGCKVDTSLILVGLQGARKSSAFMALGGAWYREGNIDPRDTKGSSEAVSGAWIFELGELDSFRRSEATALKAFMSRQEDVFRPAYGRNTVIAPRQAIFVGTTNEEAFLTDSTGNRRYWPVRVGQIDIDALTDARGQLWAEALVAYRAGERWWFDAEEEAARAEAVEQFATVDPWQEALTDLVMPPEATMHDVAGLLDIDTSQRHSGTWRRLSSVLQAMGYRPVKRKGLMVWRKGG